MPPLSSPVGRTRFQRSLELGLAESYFPLSEQFLTQSEPAFCGITTLAMTLNALKIDPLTRWKLGWRWWTDDDILKKAGLHEATVRESGIDIHTFHDTAGRICQDVKVGMFQRVEGGGHVQRGPRGQQKAQQQQQPAATLLTVKDFRSHIVESVGSGAVFLPAGRGAAKGKKASAKESHGGGGPQQSHGHEHGHEHGHGHEHDHQAHPQPPPPAADGSEDDCGNCGSPAHTIMRCTSSDAHQTRLSLLVASFSRQVLGQSGDGHFSPLGAYDPETDSVLVLDVARFKYPPYWVEVEKLYEAMGGIDETTGESRGYFRFIRTDNVSPPTQAVEEEKTDIISSRNKPQASK